MHRARRRGLWSDGLLRRADRHLNIDRIAANGLRDGQWHTTALCSPTRSRLLTGRNHTTNGMACISECAIGFPGANGHIPPECPTLGEILVERGFSTALVGKWHLCAEDEMNLASTKHNWPVARGFERFYGFLDPHRPRGRAPSRRWTARPMGHSLRRREAAFLPHGRGVRRVPIAGEGLNVGRDGGEAVTDDYPGTRPSAFTGGTLHRVAVDVSGEPFVDLEREAAAMLSRE
ncbi:sulfatase-like hydrolase/transferase [Streptomyces sp. NPDC005408]|uniref:sulfatase-like hydrolase/transferase n=1 Tax=Streptomyces sp. NPDC005408 TaxID=3155341 RepID=UPI0033B1D13F